MKRISVREKGVNYKVEVKEPNIATIYPIDGVAIREGQRCDKFITVLNEDSGVAVFLELKGRDISHAIAQLEATIKNPLFKPYPSKEDKTRARIISNRGVSSASRTDLERAKVRFLRDYKVELKQLSNLQPMIKSYYKSFISSFKASETTLFFNTKDEQAKGKKYESNAWSLF